MAATILVHIALLAYAAAAAIYLTWLVRPRDWLVPAGRALLFAGLVLHLASFGAAVSMSNGEGLARAGFGSDAWKGGQLFSLLAAATVAGYLVLDFRYRLPVAGAFVAPVTVAVMVPAHLVHSGTRAIAPALTHSTALAVHVGSAAAGTAALALAFALSLLYLASEKQLKSKHPGKLFARLPSLELIDRVGWHLSVWGFIFLSIAIATGSLVSHESSGSAFPLAPKQGFAILAWALLAGLIQARLVAGWRGRRVALLVVAGFLLLIGTYVGVLTAPPHASSSAAAILFWTGRS
ncbi:MAG TPA: cytochrome c biogenesis protein CcsA [Myxococcales bacterium]|nr:cytochrome c biogenesis protein CcsA [Myxococcales bacterium]